MSTEHMTAEDRWFATHWEACGKTITETVDAGRLLGPHAIADVKTLPSETKASEWEAGESTQDTDRAMEVRMRKAIPLTIIEVIGEVGAEPNRGERMAELAEALVETERALFVDALRPTTSLPWSTTGSLPIDDLLASAEHYDVLLNMDAEGGTILAMLRTTFEDRLGGKVIEARMGPGTPHLFVPAGSVTVHEAGTIRHRRPTAGQLRVAAVVGISCDNVVGIGALDADPT